MFKLQDWYYQDDEEVKAGIQKMKEELKGKKYFAHEFNEIIHLLMCTNNDFFGMRPSVREDYLLQSSVAYDSTDEDSVKRLSDALDNSIKADNNAYSEDMNYAQWEKQNIEEYVDYMLTYFDDDGFYKFILGKRDGYMTKKRFLSLYGYERIS